MVEPTGNVPWATPAAGAFTRELLDAGGYVLHREPVPVLHAGHGRGEALWNARVPWFDAAATVVLRGPAGDIRATSQTNRAQADLAL